ncbi:MAG: single-stranded DNA-binding protein [Bacteroidales bacterium]
MAGVNKVILIGNLGKDPEVRTLESGAKMAKFPLATSESYKNRDGQRVDVTEWHNIVLWRGLADVAETYLKKGKQVYVEGRIRTRSWEDNEGVKKYMTEIQGDNMTMLGGRPPSGSQPQEDTQAADKDIPESGGAEDDLPF